MMEPSDWLTREDVARVLRRQPRWVTDNVLRPHLLSHAKIGNEYFIERRDFDAFMRRFKKKGKIA